MSWDRLTVYCCKPYCKDSKLDSLAIEKLFSTTGNAKNL